MNRWYVNFCALKRPILVKLRQACCKEAFLTLVQPLSKGCHARNRPREALGDTRMCLLTCARRSCACWRQGLNAALMPKRKIADVGQFPRRFPFRSLFRCACATEYGIVSKPNLSPPVLILPTSSGQAGSPAATSQSSVCPSERAWAAPPLFPFTRRAANHQHLKGR